MISDLAALAGEPVPGGLPGDSECYPYPVPASPAGPGRGDALATEDLVDALRELLVPQASIVTPNSIEARRLTERDDDEEEPGLDECAHRLLALGCEYVLVKGTHEATAEGVNRLSSQGGVVREDRWQRLPGSYHGSGCTLASAIAAALANGLETPEAVREAQEYTWQALAGGFRPGMGQLLPDRFFWARKVDTESERDEP